METLWRGEAVTLSPKELEQITGYAAPLRQLHVLHQRGFVRAYRSRNGQVVLERPHYLAVCRGEFMQLAPAPHHLPSVNLDFLKQP